MLITVAIINNQNKQVKNIIAQLMDLDYKPDTIYVLPDSKDIKAIKKYPEVEIIDCENGNARNLAIQKFMKSGNDILIFMNSDCTPDTKDFLKNYELLLNNYDIVFGTRRYTDVSRLKTPPVDFLVANIDNMYRNKKFNYTDLRIVSGAVTTWKNAKTFEEKLDLILTGMICQCGNFGITHKGLKQLMKFQKNTYGLNDGIFDTRLDIEGYCDIALGIDAICAGLDIGISDGVRVIQTSRNRMGKNIDDINMHHLAMEHYRMLENTSTLWEKLKNIALVASAFFTAGLITGMVTYAVSMQQILGQ